MASGKHLRLQAWIWPHTTARKALNPCDNSITSDQNWPKQMLFHNADKKKSVFHEGFDSISGFLSASKSYDLLNTLHEFVRVAIVS